VAWQAAFKRRRRCDVDDRFILDAEVCPAQPRTDLLTRKKGLFDAAAGVCVKGAGPVALEGSEGIFGREDGDLGLFSL